MIFQTSVKRLAWSAAAAALLVGGGIATPAFAQEFEMKVGFVTFRDQQHRYAEFLEQEIEEQGLVQATANVIDYQVASGLVTLTGNADVKHPQYQISGDLLIYDLNIQHFQGSGDENGNGRIHIRLDPEVINKDREKQNKKDKEGADVPPPPAPAVENADKDDN